MKEIKGFKFIINENLMHLQQLMKAPYIYKYITK